VVEDPQQIQLGRLERFLLAAAVEEDILHLHRQVVALVVPVSL
jgi:hypothetical protein